MTYEFEVTFRNFIGVSGAAAFSIKAGTYQGISLSMNYVGSLTFKMYFDYDLNVNLVYTECTTNGTFIESPYEMSVVVRYDDDQNITRTTNILKPSDRRQVTYRILKYSLKGNLNYLLKIDAQLANDSSISAKTEVSIFVESSELLVFIEGGNRQTGYESELVVNGVAKDLDVEESAQTSGIDYEWSCQDLMNSNAPCKNIKEEQISLNQNSLR